MSHVKRLAFSIIVRRFQHEYEEDIMQSLNQLQKVAADQPGYLGDHNSLSQGNEYRELVNVFAFDSRKNLERWESSGVRNGLLAELDRHPQEATKHSLPDDLVSLLHPKTQESKIEIVVILIFWIVVLANILDYFADFILPTTLFPFWRSVLLISVNVALISYIFLPWSGKMLARFKAKFAGRTRDK